MIPEIERIEKRLLEMQDQKDRVMDLSREMIRLAGKGITMMHNGRMKDAEDLLKTLSQSAKKMSTIDKGFEYNSQQAYQEYVEAATLYNIMTKGRIPDSKELHVDEVSYLMGILDVMGELKREVFEELRKGKTKNAEKYYSFMLNIHDSLMPLRFSSSLMPDFRKKQDVGRIQLESVSSELLSFRKH